MPVSGVIVWLPGSLCFQKGSETVLGILKLTKGVCVRQAPGSLEYTCLKVRPGQAAMQQPPLSFRHGCITGPARTKQPQMGKYSDCK